jgi:hypothetical protein
MLFIINSFPSGTGNLSCFFLRKKKGEAKLKWVIPFVDENSG